MMQNYFSVGFQNIQGLHHGNTCKMTDILHDLTNDIEILAETWGCKCEHDIEGYFAEYVNPQKHMGVKKGRNSGGFIVLFKNYLGKDVKIIKKSNNFVWIEVDKKYFKNMNKNPRIVGTYIHDITSTYYSDKIFEELSRDILKFSEEGIPILFTGDFNARIGNLCDNFQDSEHEDLPIKIENRFPDIPRRGNVDNIVNSHGEKVIRFCKTFDFKILNGRMKGDKIGNFTHANANGGNSTIDYSLCNQQLYNFIENFMVLPITELSDHSKIATLLRRNNPLDIIQDNYKWNNLTKFKWDNKNKNIFCKSFFDHQNEIDEISQKIEAGLIESTGENIQNLFFKVAKTSLENKGNKNQIKGKNKKKTKKWFDAECQNLKLEVRRVGREKHSRPNFNLLTTKYHEKLKEYKIKCKSKRNLFWRNTIGEIEESLGDPNKFWKKWKNASEFPTSTTQSNIHGNEWYSFFKGLHTETRENDAPQLDKATELEKNLESVENDQPFSRKEFESVLKKLKNEKAEGSDAISNEMIKNSPKIIIDLIFKFVNLCLSKSLIPKTWCLDLLNPIHKEGSKDDPNNYRGICISSALLKIICSLLNNRVKLQSQRREIIDKNQTGFKENHRTSDNLLVLKNVVKKYVTVGEKKIYACFVDFQKAYDSVWHKGLFCKLKENNFSGKLLGLIMDIYKKTKCAVKVNGAITEYFTYSKGVRQGCPLSPILFNMYVNDIFKIMNENNGSNIFLKENEPINALMYADDLILLSETKEGLQKQIDKMCVFCTKWKLKVNIKKTKVMVFNRGNRLIKSDFYIKNVAIENVKIMKYLGFYITAKNCSFSVSLEELSIKANRAIYALNNKIKLSRLPTKLALRVFDTQIKPILLYGAEVWGAYTDYDFSSWEKSKIEMTHVQFIKRVLGCNFNTSNLMARGEVGARPLLIDTIKRIISYINNIKGRQDTIAHSAYEFETKNDVAPNFNTFVNKFDLTGDEGIIGKSNNEIKKICQHYYDRCWKVNITESPKAILYKEFKTNVSLEKYLTDVKNRNHKIALTRFRVSNHDLLIEKGRHFRPKIEREDRKCFLCKDHIEDERHFITKCPLYKNERILLYRTINENSIFFEAFSDEQKFLFIMTNENENVINGLAKFVSNSMNAREKELQKVKES